MKKIYVVPTPIGNLEDITIRALDILKTVDLVLAEDTRKSKKLFDHFDIKTPLSSYHQHNEHKKIKKIVDDIQKGVVCALISDAGTPSISDPGFLLIRECIKNNILIETLPGATAFVPALVNSGLPTDKFIFEGFLPHKKGRSKRLLQLSKEGRTIILYESPHRILKTLDSLMKYFSPDRKASISRELTKIYEETQRGTLAELFSYFSEKKVKGEFVIVVDGCK